MPPGQPDHTPTRGPVSQHVPRYLLPRPRSTNKHSPCTYSAASIMTDNTCWVAPPVTLPATVTGVPKQQCLASVRMLEFPNVAPRHSIVLRNIPSRRLELRLVPQCRPTCRSSRAAQAHSCCCCFTARSSLFAALCDRPRNPALSPITAKLSRLCFAFQRPLTNCQQRLQAVNLSFHYLHSCVMPSVDSIRRGSHSPRSQICFHPVS